jgi:iron(III) transport system substrate-binding protein
MSLIPCLLVALALAAIVACGPAPAAAPKAAPAPAQPAAQPASRPAEPSAGKVNYDHPAWKELIEAARREGKLILASGPSPETRLKLPAAFKERFGIEVEYLGGRSSELQTRLRGERSSGVYTVDVIIGGGDTSVAMHQDGWFAPIKPLLVVPEVRDPSVFRGNRLPFLDPEEQSMFELEASVTGAWIVNPQVVRDGELTKLDEVLDPKWRGKISVEDPTVPGQGMNDAVYLYMHKGEDFFRRLFVDQQPAISRDDRQMQDWLARGTYPVSYGLSARDAEEMQQQGLPAKVLGPLDGPGWLAGGFSVLAMFTNPPHPNAAKLFVNWMASPDGMAVHADAEGQVPLRKDVPHPWVQDYQVPKEGVSYVHLYDYKYITEEKPVITQRIRQIVAR